MFLLYSFIYNFSTISQELLFDFGLLGSSCQLLRPLEVMVVITLFYFIQRTDDFQSIWPEVRYKICFFECKWHCRKRVQLKPITTRMHVEASVVFIYWCLRCDSKACSGVHVVCFVIINDIKSHLIVCVTNYSNTRFFNIFLSLCNSCDFELSVHISDYFRRILSCPAVVVGYWILLIYRSYHFP